MIVKLITRVTSVFLLAFSLWQFGLNVWGYYRDLPVSVAIQQIEMLTDEEILKTRQARRQASPTGTYDYTFGDVHTELRKLNSEFDRFKEFNEVLVSLVAVILSLILFELAFRNERRELAM
jgi:hypothetical protein